MFGKIKWLFLILPVIFFMTCELGDDIESKKDPGSVTLTFNANGGVGTQAPITGKIGTGIVLPDQGTISKGNDSFDGWNVNALGIGSRNYLAGETFVLPNSDTTLYAVWAPYISTPYTKKYSLVGPTFVSGNLGTGWTDFKTIDNITIYYKDDFDIASLKSDGYTTVTLKYNYIISVWGDIEYDLQLHNVATGVVFINRIPKKENGNNKTIPENREWTINLSEIVNNNTFDTLEFKSRHRKQNLLWGGDFKILNNRGLEVIFSKQ